MKKIIIFFLVILFYPQISFGEEETYLSQVDNCEKKNKKMGELAWKQCVDKIHYKNSLYGYSGSASFVYEKDKLGELKLLEIFPKNNSKTKKKTKEVNSPDDKIAYFKAGIQNYNENFLITKIENIEIEIPGKDKILVSSDFIKVWPSDSKAKCSLFLEFNPAGCLIIDLTPFDLKRSDIEGKNWSWYTGQTYGVKIIKPQNSFFSTKTRLSDIEKCINRNTRQKYSGLKNEFERACKYALASELESRLVKHEEIFYKLNTDGKPENYFRYKILNDISNDFKITRFEIDINYKGKDCKGNYWFKEKVDIEPGSNFNSEKKIEENFLFILTLHAKK